MYACMYGWMEGRDIDMDGWMEGRDTDMGGRKEGSLKVNALTF